MTNVKLSQEESRIVTDAGLILTKNRIIQKVYDLFGDISESYTSSATALPGEVLAIPPKISKGENYKGLPWVMLDYPRKFTQADVFAIRSFFWWGNFFSITLHLQGTYLHSYAAPVTGKLSGNAGWSMCMDTGDAWQHHFDNGYYVPYTKGMDLAGRPFIKLAKKIPLQQWDDAPGFFRDSFNEILGWLSTETVK